MRTPLVILASTLCACATTVGDVQSKSEVAILAGESSGVGSAVNPLAVNYSVVFRNLDGKDLSSLFGAVNPGQIEVQPGRHSVVALCSWKRGGLNIRGEQLFVQDFAAGRVYYFKPVLRDGGQCGLDLRIN